MEKHRCFISYKKEDKENGYLDKILKVLDQEQIKGKALDKWIDSDDIDYIMQKIREEYLSNTSVTIFVIGSHSSENEGCDYHNFNKQSFIIRELQASLYDGKGNRRSGILGIVLPHMEEKIFKGSYYCCACQTYHSIIDINDETVIREFSENYYLRKSESACGEVYQDEDSFCALVKYTDFINDPNKYINQAYAKTKSEINNFVHWRDIKHKYKLKQKVLV